MGNFFQYKKSNQSKPTNEKYANKNNVIVNKFYKIVLVGDRSVGKSSFVTKIVNDDFSLEIRPTIGIENSVKKIDNITLQFWDKSSRTKYKTINEIYYKNSKIVILMFSLENRQTFENLDYWIDEIMSHKSLSKIILVGTHSDTNQNEINFKDIEKLKNKLNCEYFSTSAINGDGYENILNYILEITK